jgi:hypothetical protein
MITKPTDLLLSLILITASCQTQASSILHSQELERCSSSKMYLYKELTNHGVTLENSGESVCFITRGGYAVEIIYYLSLGKSLVFGYCTMNHKKCRRMTIEAGERRPIAKVIVPGAEGPETLYAEMVRGKLKLYIDPDW